jgi:predicted O-methyltransferase YrrM
MGGARVLRGIGRESGKLVDLDDPLRSYNRRLVWSFLTRTPAQFRANAQLLPVEGHMKKAQAHYFQQLLVDKPWVRNIAEVGFNAGHSSYLFLNSRPDVQVTSFDLGEHAYIHLAKWIIDEHFPGRHELVIGDSRETVPAFTISHPDRRFDLIFIDGGHQLEVARADIENCRSLAIDRTIVIMDDLNANTAYGKGPVRAWADAQHDRLIVEDVLVEDGSPVLVLDSGAPQKLGYRWALGHYLWLGRRSKDAVALTQ